MKINNPKAWSKTYGRIEDDNFFFWVRTLIIDLKEPLLSFSSDGWVVSFRGMDWRMLRFRCKQCTPFGWNWWPTTLVIDAYLNMGKKKFRKGKVEINRTALFSCLHVCPISVVASRFCKVYGSAFPLSVKHETLFYKFIFIFI